jgi:hypothetical protein
MTGSPGLVLPAHPVRTYPLLGRCLYCGTTEGELSKEHIIPRAAGGRWTLAKASCAACAVITGRFEGGFTRTVIGPLRMLYNMSSRRRGERPDHLPLKARFPGGDGWEIVQVHRSVCPFLVGLPLWPLPDALTGEVSLERGDATRQFWLRGAGFQGDIDAHLEWLCALMKAEAVMPTAQIETAPIALTLAKIAHAFAVAELGPDAFEPFLTEIIRTGDLSDRATWLGGGQGNEPPDDVLHQLAFDPEIGFDPDVIAVRVRLLGVLGTPTYHLAVGRRR